MWLWKGSLGPLVETAAYVVGNGRMDEQRTGLKSDYCVSFFPSLLIITDPQMNAPIK